MDAGELVQFLAYIGLGSNLGDRRVALDTACHRLGELPGHRLTGVSAVYETAPVGPQDQPAYLNQVAAMTTPLEPVALMRTLLEIEQQMGRAPRTEATRWGPRVIDLDLLLYDERTVEVPGLTLPHPRMHERWFVLKPLADLAPDLMIPGQVLSVKSLLEALAVPPSHESISGKCAD